TTSALDRMTYGADTLNTASTNFARAGEGVAGVMHQAAAVTGKLTELTGAMTTSSSSLRDTVADYRGQRDAVASLVAELRTVVQTAKTEASLTIDIVARIHSATDKLAMAQKQADEYLNTVSKVLGEAHEAFADTTMKTLSQVNLEFHQKLSAAVGLLSN